VGEESRVSKAAIAPAAVCASSARSDGVISQFYGSNHSKPWSDQITCDVTFSRLLVSAPASRKRF
jgi:hypothetical protein